MTKEETRAAMPTCAKWLDEMRLAFEDQPEFGPCWQKRKIPYISARENGVEVTWGRRTEYRED